MRNNPAAKMGRHIGLSLLLTLALTFFGCSSDDGGEEKYAYCVFMEQQTCLSGSFTSCQNGGNLSQSCPFNVDGLSSGGTGGGVSSSSGTVAGNGDGVQIGTQVWMKKNLDVEVAGSRCYDDLQANCDKYGRLYDWATAMALPASCNTNECASQISAKHRGICPIGWHIPSKDEWETLSNYVESAQSCSSCDAKHLKANSDWNSNGNGHNGNGQDTYGFAALPSGNLYLDNGRFSNVGYFSLWWSASEKDASLAYYRSMSYKYEYTSWGNSMDKTALQSVRCVKD